MDERHALTAAIVANPDDDLPRLVYADWLDEHGESDRAEFIRVQCEQARLAEGDPRRLLLEDRAAELQNAHLETWLGPLRPYLPADEISFHRGVIESIVCTAEDFVRPDYQDAALRVFPSFGVAHLGLLNSFRQRPLLEGLVRSLFVGYEGLIRPTPEPVLQQLFDSPALGWVSHLQLFGDATSDRSLDRLLDSGHAGRLAQLSLNQPRCTDAGLTALARSTAVSNLRSLGLVVLGSRARFTASGVRAVVGSEKLPHLGKLGLSGDLPRRFRLGELLADPAVARLRSLELGAADSFALVARCRHLTALEEARFYGREVRIADGDAMAFLGNPALAAVKALWLVILDPGRVQLSDAVVARLRDRFGDGFQLSFFPVT